MAPAHFDFTFYLGSPAGEIVWDSCGLLINNTKAIALAARFYYQSYIYLAVERDTITPI